MITTSHIKDNGKIDVWDMGPPEPKPLAKDVPYEHPDAVAYRTAKAEREAWVKAGSKPTVVEFAPFDAQHALAADPARYRIGLSLLREPATIEERVTELEARVEELDHFDKKRAEAHAKEGEKLAAERTKTPGGAPAGFAAQGQMSDEQARAAMLRAREAADADAARRGPAQPTTNPNWPAAPPAPSPSRRDDGV